MTVSLVARPHCPKPAVYLAQSGGPSRPEAAGSGEEAAPASDYRTLQNQARELHRPLGKKILEVEILWK
jgi:hypothetical protein